MIYSCWCHHVPFSVFPMTTDKSVKAAVFSHLLQVNNQEQNPGQSVLKVGWAGGLLPCLPGSRTIAFTLNACTGSWSLHSQDLGSPGLTEWRITDGHEIKIFFFLSESPIWKKKQGCIPIFLHDSGSHVHICFSFTKAKPLGLSKICLNNERQWEILQMSAAEYCSSTIVLTKPCSIQRK